MTRRTLLVALLLLLPGAVQTSLGQVPEIRGAAAVPAAAGIESALGGLTGRLSQRLERLAASGSFTGELLVTAQEGIRLSQTFGGQSPGDIYAVGSVTKSLTAVAMLLLAQRGQLDLGDPLARFFPEVEPSRLQKDGRQVTLDHLLSHTSGLDGLRLLPTWASDRPDAAVARMLASAHLGAVPGVRRQYSNEGYVLLGEVIRRTTGESYEAYVRKAICGPLGLGDTGIVIEPRKRSRLAPGMVASAWSLHPSLSLFPYRLEKGYAWPGESAGGMRSTVTDLDHFLRGALAGPLLAPSWREQLRVGALPDRPRFGRGFINTRVDELLGDITWHNGELSPLGFQSFAGMFLDRSVVVVVLANVDSSAGDLTDIVLAALQGEAAPPLARLTADRLFNSSRVLYLGPVAAAAVLLIVAVRSLRLLRRFSERVTAAASVLAFVAVGLMEERTPVFAGGLVLAGALSGWLLLRPPRSPLELGSPRTLASLLAGLIALFVCGCAVVIRGLLA